MARRLDVKGQYNSAEASEENIISVLTTVDASNYPATIAGQIDRIGDAHEIIQRKALKMKLKVPAGQGDSKPAKTTELTLNHLLMDTAAAINTISVITEEQNKILDAGAEYIVPVGYNTKEYSVTAKTVADNLESTTLLPSGEDLISGVTAYTIKDGNAIKVTGSLEDYRGTDQEAAAYIDISGNLAFEIPATGAYSREYYLTSNIPYLTSAGDLTIDVKHIGSDKTTLIEDFVIPAGYYPHNTAVSVSVVDNGEDIGEINILPELVVTGDGTFGPGTDPDPDASINKFDYIKQVKVNKAGGFSIIDNVSRKLSVGSYDPTNKRYGVTAANIIGKFSTAGWITTGNNTDSSVVVGNLPKATFGFNNNVVKSTGAGYIPSGETLLTMSPYTYGMSLANTTTAISSTGDNTGDVAANHYYVKFKVNTAGYAPIGDHYHDIGLPVSCSDFKTSATASVTYASKVVNAQTTYLDITGNYQPGAQYVKATVRSASAPTLSITDKTDTVTVGQKNTSGKFPISVSNLTGTISVNTPGWFTGGTATNSSVIVGTLPASIHNYGIILLGKDLDSTLNKDLLYVPCTISAGYTPGETAYLELGKAGIKDIHLTTTDNYREIEAGTYYIEGADIFVEKVDGILKDLSGETNVGITITTPLENLTSDTTIIGTDNLFLSSITIEVTGIIDKLSKI